METRGVFSSIFPALLNRLQVVTGLSMGADGTIIDRFLFLSFFLSFFLSLSFSLVACGEMEEKQKKAELNKI